MNEHIIDGVSRREPAIELGHEALRRRVQVSIEQAERGEVEPWDIEAILAEAHRRHTHRDT